MKIKTSTLKDAALDWAVWTAAGGAAAYPGTASGKAFLKLWKGNSAKYIHPSTNWSQGGTVIEREGINTYQTQDGTWQANLDYGMVDEAIYHGPTPLIAAMRCFVASRLGDEIEIPDEVLQ